MDNTKRSGADNSYPSMIQKLPQIDISIPGIKGWLLQGGKQQVVFFDIEPVDEMPPHSHCAQWGIMVEGEMKLTFDGKSRIYRKGDRYFVPEGVVHSAAFFSRVHVIDIFDDPKRYGIKKE